MGVTGLWQILHPCARPIKLETLNRKRLAVDASIWIYQFLKAVRDKEGNALRNSHVVGFFRRICKLLFFGIKPVFVFDGDAPLLKRQTISERKKRREGRRDDAVRTAGRLLAVQMQRRAEEEDMKRKEEQQRGPQGEEAVPDEGLVYVDEIAMTQQERNQNRKFRKKDQYHLPDLDVSMTEMGGANDPRVMSLEELQSYAKQFETGEDINVYDFSKIDYDSTFFMSLPASDRYNILNAARLRSRLRMGHSKEQLDTMFPDRMAFSKFQIERVTERNELTQRLMHLNEGGDAFFPDGGRVAGEKGREYVLVKNDGVEGGWALGVISDEGTKQETAIDIDKSSPVKKREDEEDEDEDEFEDVPIEGLNRLPKRQKMDDGVPKQRSAFYDSRKRTRREKPRPAPDTNSLFIQVDEPVQDIEEEEEWEEVDANGELFGEEEGEAQDEELQRAIAMSLGQDQANQPEASGSRSEEREEEDDDMLEVFNQSAAPEAGPIPKAGGRAIANIVNKRAFDTAPESREVTSFGVQHPKSDDESEEDETMDLQAALAESRKGKRKITPPPRRQPSKPSAQPASDVAKKPGFSGPLPFEKLDLGSSLLGKKKMQERSEEAAGGFENPQLANKEQKKDAEPLPPWFAGNIDEDMKKQNMLESEDRQRAKEFSKQFRFQSREEIPLRKEASRVIDLEAEDEPMGFKDGEVIDLDSEDELRNEVVDLQRASRARETPKPVLDTELRMGDLAEKAKVEPPAEVQEDRPKALPPTAEDTVPVVPLETGQPNEQVMEEGDVPLQRSQSPEHLPKAASATAEGEDEDEPLDWSESEEGTEQERGAAENQAAEFEQDSEQRKQSRSPSAEFEDVDMTGQPRPAVEDDQQEDQEMAVSAPASGLIHQESIDEDEQVEFFDDFSDPEEEDLLKQLTLEAEEHARFASTLNNKSQAQNIADYEKELKQLRNQQKKDRRDADEVTHIMVQECQQLLRLFGLPYVTAPMEAEAQCAELVKLGLVDGIVTDDSDCFLFGGTRIYKNMFNQAKFVECYLTSDLEKEFELTREKLIQVAQLLGSDYTEGLPGVGPVTALEILGEFQTLNDFKTWWEGVQMNTIPKSADAGNAFRKKFRRNATKLFLPPSFPDTRVDSAYANPNVDSDPEHFQWGVPDLDALRSFLMATIGWTQERTDEVLVPVIKDMNRRVDEGTQSNITKFFEGGVGIGAAGANKASARGEAFAPRKKAAEGSKRMGSALSRMAEKAKMGRGGSVAQSNGSIVGEDQAAATDDAPSTAAKPVKSKKAKPGKRNRAESELDTDSDESDFEQPKKQTKKRAINGKASRGHRKKAQASD